MQLSIASRTCGGRGSGVVVGKLLKFYFEFNCLDHEHIAQGFKFDSHVRIGSRAPKTLVRLFKPIVWSRSVLHEYDELMPEALNPSSRGAPGSRHTRVGEEAV